MSEYQGRLPLFHVDLYRLADGADAFAGGVVDERQAAGVTLVEWPDRMGDFLPARRLDVLIDGTGTEPRTITLRAGDPALARYLATASPVAAEGAA
jgi:tRNA A37 threonylcarbamoyladenosine biosynthesis protein TsaE